MCTIIQKYGKEMKLVLVKQDEISVQNTLSQ
jgi:hypothetical protein